MLLYKPVDDVALGTMENIATRGICDSESVSYVA